MENQVLADEERALDRLRGSVHALGLSPADTAGTLAELERKLAVVRRARDLFNELEADRRTPVDQLPS